LSLWEGNDAMKPRTAHSPETIGRLRERGTAQFATPEARRKHGELTKAKMAAAAPLRAELARLRDAWALASPDARRRLLRDLCDAKFCAADRSLGEACGRG
jgi:hypothetical protein